jgi:hypothetical protein
VHAGVAGVTSLKKSQERLDLYSQVLEGM